jgi:cytochrome c
MKYRKIVAILLAAALPSASAVADDFSDPGRRIFERRCQSCHAGESARPNAAPGPSLVGVFGRKAGTADSGVHSPAAIEYGVVWTRSSVRRFISDPGREVPGTLMQVRVQDSKELDDLLNYLETLR